MRLPFFVSLLLIAGACGACTALDGGYAARVLIHQNSGTDDFRWKRQSVVPASTDARPLPETLQPAAVKDAFAAADGASLEDWLKSGRTFGFVVLKEGSVIYEYYGEGSARDQPQAGFSLSKTFFATVLARAVEDGTLTSLDAPLETYVPELAARDANLKGITLQDLLDMRSGIGFEEDAAFPWLNRDAPSVYYASDLARTVIRKPQPKDPRGTFVYNDYAPNLNGLALQRASGKRLADDGLNRLWRDMGANDLARWQEDQQGFAYHESGLVLTARDLARFGQLWLEDPDDVIPDAFATDVFTPDARSFARKFGETSLGYRDGWWILKAPDGSEDLLGMGDHGQLLLVSPSTNIVMARLGRDGAPETNVQVALRMQRAAHALSGR